MKLLRPVFLIPMLTLAASGDDRPHALAPRPARPAPKFEFNLLPRSLQWRPALDIWVVTERTERGAQVPEPNPAEPQFYQLVSGGHHDRGTGLAKQVPAKADAIARVLESALREQSLLPAEAAQPATLVLTYTWGTHFRERPRPEELDTGRTEAFAAGRNWGGRNPWQSYPALEGPRTPAGGGSWGYGTGDNGGWTFGPTSAGADSGGGAMGSSAMGSQASISPSIEVPAPMSHADLCDRAALLIGETLARDLRQQLARIPEDVGRPGEAWGALCDAARRHPRGHFLLTTLDESLYYVVVSAFDAKALAEGRKELLWRTKIAVTDDGISQVEAMPAVVAAAGRYFGRDTGHGQMLQRKLDRKGRVVVGEPEVIDWQMPTERNAAPSGPPRR